MKRKLWVGCTFGLFVLSIFLPWFTFNARMMGYCWGYRFLPWMIVPLIVIVIYLLQDKSKMFKILSEFSLMSILTVYVIAFGRWQEFCNIASGFQWHEGFYTATAGYWVSVLLFVVFSIILQFELFRKK